MKNIKYFLLTQFLLFPLLSKADVWDNVGSALILMHAIQVNFLVVLIFFLAYNYWKKRKHLTAFLIIGITWILYFGFCFLTQPLHEFFSDPFLMVSWMPITGIFILMGSTYFLKKFWDSYPNE